MAFIDPVYHNKLNTTYLFLFIFYFTFMKASLEENITRKLLSLSLDLLLKI